MTTAVSAEGIKYAYPDGTLALDGVSFDIREGERVAFVGANGAGKSTLLLTLNGVLKGEGTVRIHGVAVEARNMKAVRRMVGIVFQNPDDQLFCPTALDDVMFGPLNMGLSRNDAMAKAEKTLADVGLSDVGGKSPFHLSHGQKKRVAMATVLSMDCRVLALDEPTSGLDPKGRKEAIKLMGGLSGSLIVATHDFGLVRELCDRVIILSKGKNVADGTPSVILSDSVLLAEHGLE
ncbi:MAG: energy-coupling factor ABC transporter ATP-binding protein [Nitrospinae bacterium]|nr:energy-coupling factor ABC transporter ATP-binding protein [Nitrospinota bacterium]